jgi:DNA-binding MarR family transcriptional regulator
VSDLLKPHDLTPAQYNVLRILRGARAQPMTCGDVAGRLVTFEPDVTRLIDRLAHRHLVVRSRDGEDRRQVRLRITPAGLDLLKRLDEPLASIHDRTLGQLGDERLSQLIGLLESIRDHAVTNPPSPEPS